MSRPLARPTERARATAAAMRAEIAGQLRAARLVDGRSRRQLAEAAGLNWHTVDAIERGRGTSWQSVAQYAEALGLAVYIEVEPL